MLYIYRRKPSDSARDLAEGMNLNCRKVGDLGRVHYGQGVRGGDRVVCWGETLTPIEGVEILNGTPLINKLQAALKLREAGVKTIEVSTTQPPETPALDPLIQGWQGLMREVTHPLTRVDILRVGEMVRTMAPLPLIPQTAWLARTLNHLGGRDLLNPPATPNFWVKKEEIVKEYRIHLFRGRSIRAGVKVHNLNSPNHHAWVRSLDGGWRISYDGFTSSKGMRKLANEAVKALSLDFGAVDLAEKADGTLLVLEVNRAPGLGDGTINAYSDAIQAWVEGREE